MSTEAPMCRLCKQRHRLGDPHIWVIDEEPKKERVHNPKPKPDCVHKTEKIPKGVYTARKVSIRQLRSNMAEELKDLPFDIIRNGIVIARVIKP